MYNRPFGLMQSDIRRLDVVLRLLGGLFEGLQTRSAVYVGGQGETFVHALLTCGATSVTAVEPSAERRTLDALVSEGSLPVEIGALVIADGQNSFTILEGMGCLSAAIVLLEYCGDAPVAETPPRYGVEDVTRWMRERGFSSFALFNRTQAPELIQVNDAQTHSEDRGHIVFLHDLLAPQLLDVLFRAAADAQDNLLQQVKSFTRETLAARSVIERLQERIEDLEHASRARLGASEVVTEPPPTLVDIMQRQTRILQRLEARLETTDLAALGSGQPWLNQREWLSRLDELERRRIAADAAANARLAVIEDLQRTLERERFWSWGERVRRSWSPKLGVLYQHAPRQLQIPDGYVQRRVQSAGLPTVSIVTPSLNQGAFIERTILSVLDQHYANLEYIIQDANSSDGTLGIVQRYAASLGHVDSRLDDGFAHGLNLGFIHATGAIMGYLNSDDVLLPGTLDYVVDHFGKHPEVDVVYGHRIVIDEYDAEIGRWILPEHDDDVLSWADYVPQETLFWRRSMWDKVGGSVDESFQFAVDWDLLLRFRDAGARFARLPRFLGAFRVHPHQKTSTAMEVIGQGEMAGLRQRCHGRRVTSEEIATAIRPYLRRHVVLHKLYRLGIMRY
jgi:hypothetical protein